MSKCKSWLKIVSMLIVISVVVGAIPLFKVSADSVETSSANLKVTYTQVSSWGSTVQAKALASTVREDDPDFFKITGRILDGFGDAILDTIFVFTSLVFQTPPSTVSTIVSTIEMISEVSRIEVPDEDKE